MDDLPEGVATPAAERILDLLRALFDDPVLHALKDAPPDDVSETEEERATVAEEPEALARGPGMG